MTGSKDSTRLEAPSSNLPKAKRAALMRPFAGQKSKHFGMKTSLGSANVQVHRIP
jgi:hypothetical protein